MTAVEAGRSCPECGPSWLIRDRDDPDVYWCRRCGGCIGTPGITTGSTIDLPSLAELFGLWWG